MAIQWCPSRAAQVIAVRTAMERFGSEGELVCDVEDGECRSCWLRIDSMLQRAKDDEERIKLACAIERSGVRLV
jgi:hypothetical protein